MATVRCGESTNSRFGWEGFREVLPDFGFRDEFLPQLFYSILLHCNKVDGVSSSTVVVLYVKFMRVWSPFLFLSVMLPRTVRQSLPRRAISFCGVINAGQRLKEFGLL